MHSCRLICLLVLVSIPTSFVVAQSEIDDDFFNYRINVAVGNALKEKERLVIKQKDTDELIALDTLLRANNTVLIKELQRFGHFSFLFFEDSMPTIDFDNETADPLEFMLAKGRLPTIKKMQAQQKLEIHIVTRVAATIEVLPAIFKVTKDKQWAARVAVIYLEAIKERISGCEALKAKKFTFAAYQDMETRAKVDTPDKQVRYREDFMRFIYAKYNAY